MKKQVYWCACLDSDCQRKATCGGRPKPASLVSEESLTKHHAIISLLPFSSSDHNIITCNLLYGRSITLIIEEVIIKKWTEVNTALFSDNNINEK